MLLLKFADCFSVCSYKEFTQDKLLSILIILRAIELGALHDSEVLSSFQTGREGEIIEALNSLAAKDTTNSWKIKNLISVIQWENIEFDRTVIEELRLVSSYTVPKDSREERRRHESYDWRACLTPILRIAALKGFSIDSEIVKPSGVVIQSSTLSQTLNGKDWAPLANQLPDYDIAVHLFSSEKNDVALILTSDIDESDPSYISGIQLVNTFLANCSLVAADKDFILWIVYDRGLLNEEVFLQREELATKCSRGLKTLLKYCIHPIRSLPIYWKCSFKATMVPKQIESLGAHFV